jgi:acyl carrier protein
MTEIKEESVSVERHVREFLTKELGKDVTTIDAGESLLESGTLDSVGVLRLVAFLEQTYSIRVGDDDLMPDNFDTLAAISTFVENRQTQSRG